MFMYYIFCAMALAGALGVLLFKEYVSAAMSMLVCMLGVAGLMLFMKAYLLTFLMVAIYVGAVMVLFLFIVMLVGDKKQNISIWKAMLTLILWAIMAIGVAFVSPYLDTPMYTGESVLSYAKNYGVEMFSAYMLHFQLAGALMLVAVVSIIVISKDKIIKKNLK